MTPSGSSTRSMEPPTRLHGFPVFAVSIAVQQRGKLEIGVIYDPMRQEIFTATRGGGAHLENHRMRVSKQRGLEGSLLSTGFPLPRG